MESNIIILKSVYKITKVYMEPAVDSNGRFPSVVRKTDSFGNMMLNDEDKKSGKYLIADNDMIEIFDGKSFDLLDPVDAAWWEAIKLSPRIAQDRSARNSKGELVIDGDTKRYGTAEFYVERPGQEAKAKNNRKREVHEAKAFIYDDSSDGLYQKARLLGNPMQGAVLSDVEEYLVGIAEAKPDKIRQLYTGTDTHLRILLLDAVEKRVIFYKDKLYIYGEDIILGPTQDTSLMWMKNADNKRLLDHIKKETYPDLYEVEGESDLDGVPKKAKATK